MEINSKDEHFLLEELTPDTEYAAQIRATSGNKKSNWSPVYRFNTISKIIIIYPDYEWLDMWYGMTTTINFEIYINDEIRNDIVISSYIDGALPAGVSYDSELLELSGYVTEFAQFDIIFNATLLNIGNVSRSYKINTFPPG